MNRRYESDKDNPRERSIYGRRRTGKWFLILLLVIAVGVWFAPAVALKTGVRNKVVQWAVPDFPGKVVVGSGSAGWLTPIELRDVAVWDADGNPIARIPLITSEKQPISWISNPNQLGEFILHNPEIQLIITKDGSNLESLIEPLIPAKTTGPSVTASSPPVGFGLSVVEGRVLIDDQVAQTSTVIDNLNLQVRFPDAPPSPIEVSLSAVAQQQAMRGNVAVDFSWLMPNEFNEHDLGDGKLRLKSDGFPLVALQPLLRRSQSDLYVAGQLVSDLTCQWRRTTNGPAIEATGTVNLQQPHVQMQSVLGSDQIQLNQLNTTIDVASQDNLINLNSIRLDSDVANLEVSGTAGLAEILSSSNIASKLLDWKSSHQFQIRGNVDIAGLARQLPNTIRLRRDTQISQGQISLNLISRIELGQRAIQGTIRTDRIDAMTDGRPVSWDQPLQLNLNAASSADGVTIQKLTCQSEFLQVNGQGTLAKGALSAQGDLQELVTQIGRFCDIGDLQLAGQLSANGQWQRTADYQYEALLKGNIEQFAAISSQLSPIKEDHLELTSSGRFTLNERNELVQLDALQLQVESGEDQLLARLNTPVRSPSAVSEWPISLNLSGNTETWIARLQPFVDTTGMGLHARISASLAGTIHPAKIALNPVDVVLTNVAARAPGWLIREPEVKLLGSFEWDGTKNTLATPSLTLTSRAISARAADINVVIDGENTSATGAIAFRGNLRHLWGWQYSDQPRSTILQGEVQGKAQLATQNGFITFRANSAVTDFILQQRTVSQVPEIAANTPWSPVWNEPNLRLIANGKYDPKQDRLELTGAEANGEGVVLVAGGNLVQLTGSPQADLKGEIGYDLTVLSNKLRPSLGPDIQLSGNRKTQFAIRGPLVASSLSVADGTVTNGAQSATALGGSGSPLIPIELFGEAGLSWDAIHAFGVTLGPQEISTRLQQGTLFFSPLQTNVGGGQVHLSPRIEFNADPMTLAMDQGSIDQVQITPEMFRTWFKYIAPLLANAATAEGQLSVAMQQVRVPIVQPMASNVTGRVTIHGARVEAGPMAQQVVGIVNEVSTLLNRAGPKLSFLNAGEKWMELAPQEIDFQMTQGRVFHRNLELQAGKVLIRTQGWVGMDQTVGMMADIPVQDSWIEGRKLLEGLRGQSIQIPIHGTFSKPQLDRSAITQLSRKLIGNTAERLLQQELQRGLQKLLGPK